MSDTIKAFEEAINYLLYTENAFKRYKDLSDTQHAAILDLGYTLKQVESPEFEKDYTAHAALALLVGDRAKNGQEALDMLQGLDPQQTHAFVYDGFTLDQVKDPSLEGAMETRRKLGELGITNTKSKVSSKRKPFQPLQNKKKQKPNLRKPGM